MFGTLAAESFEPIDHPFLQDMSEFSEAGCMYYSSVWTSAISAAYSGSVPTSSRS